MPITETDVMQTIAQACNELFVIAVTPADSLHSIGGDSMMAVELHTVLVERLHPFELEWIYDADSFADLAARIASAAPDSS